MRRQIYRDRLSTPARVIVGSVIGAFLGFALWVRPGRGYVSFHRTAGVTSLVCAIAIGAVAVGVAAGVWGDRLWHEDD